MRCRGLSPRNTLDRGAARRDDAHSSEARRDNALIAINSCGVECTHCDWLLSAAIVPVGASGARWGITADIERRERCRVLDNVQRNTDLEPRAGTRLRVNHE